MSVRLVRTDLKQKHEPSKGVHIHTYALKSTNERAWTDVKVASMQANCSGAFSVPLAQREKGGQEGFIEGRMAKYVNTQHIHSFYFTDLSLSKNQQVNTI